MTGNDEVGRAPRSFKHKRSTSTLKNTSEKKTKPKTMQKQQIGTFNCQGLVTSKMKQRMLADDFEKYKMTALAVQETHLKGYGVLTLRSTTNKEYLLYYSGHKTKSENGVGIILPSTKKVTFTPINDRLCQITTKINNKQTLHIISAYAPTSEHSEKHPEVREQFYTDLESVVRKQKSRHITMVAGDFNAKTGSAKNDKIYHLTIGKYGKGIVNQNGYQLLNFAKANSMKITNTFYKHKSSHISTWEAPERKNAHIDRNSNTTRKNRYRNQIDYILIKRNRGITINDSRSYGGMMTTFDHKLVMVKCIFKWPYTVKPKTTPKINLKNLQNQEIKDCYTTEISSNLSQYQQPKDNQERWTQIVESLTKAATKVLGTVKNYKQHNDPEILVLSEKQKNIKLQIDSNSAVDNSQLKIQRNKILTRIHRIIKDLENKRIEQQLQEIEITKDDSTRMFQAIKHMQRCKPKAKLLIKTKEGNLTAEENDQAELIAQHFKNQFFKYETNTIEITPLPMSVPFTCDEIQRAVKTLKNNKSAGIDGIKAEMLKNAPELVFETISKILNETARSGEHPKEITEGVITALQKPGKPKGPIENLRPITLLSMLRKILAIRMRNRIIDRLDQEIPTSQAAYRTGRSTTEHVFATKIMAEKAITSTTEKIYLLMLDMSKAFDTVNRTILLNDLSKTIEKDELHMISIMLNTELRVRCGSSLSEAFETDTGVPQGDSLSANQFTYYLAKALKIDNKHHNDHDYTSYTQALAKQISTEHNYTRSICNTIDINQEYADDISIITTNPNTIKYSKQHLPTLLSLRNLQINHTKTEEFVIERNGCDKWRKCKLLGSLLDTNSDVKRRKGLAIAAINNMKSLFYGKISLNIKIRAFSCYVESIFLYNSELWSLTTSIENSIDSFHRRLLRTACLNIKWPRKMKNEEVYNITKAVQWSSKIRKRQLSWFGHLMRLPDDTPAKISLNYSLHHVSSKPRGRQLTNWISMMKTRLILYGTTWEKACALALDRKEWNHFINSHCESMK